MQTIDDILTVRAALSPGGGAACAQRGGAGPASGVDAVRPCRAHREAWR